MWGTQFIGLAKSKGSGDWPGLGFGIGLGLDRVAGNNPVERHKSCLWFRAPCAP